MTKNTCKKYENLQDSYRTNLDLCSFFYVFTLQKKIPYFLLIFSQHSCLIFKACGTSKPKQTKKRSQQLLKNIADAHRIGSERKGGSVRKWGQWRNDCLKLPEAAQTHNCTVNGKAVSSMTNISSLFRTDRRPGVLSCSHIDSSEYKDDIQSTLIQQDSECWLNCNMGKKVTPFLAPNGQMAVPRHLGADPIRSSEGRQREQRV